MKLQDRCLTKVTEVAIQSIQRVDLPQQGLEVLSQEHQTPMSNVEFSMNKYLGKLHGRTVVYYVAIMRYSRGYPWIPMDSYG